MNIFFIRHGHCLSIVNQHENRSIVPIDSENTLTDLGIRKIKETAKNLSHVIRVDEYTKIITGTMPRAEDSAKLISSELGLSYKLDNRLNERVFHYKSKLSVLESKNIQVVTNLDPDLSLNGIESLRSQHDRVGDCINGLLLTPRIKNVLIISHGGVINNALCYLLKIPLDGAPMFNCDCAKGHQLSIVNFENTKVVKFLRMNSDFG
ncbi:histidine phosphatase family protein [Vibrio parahaemolyticus]|nr:histidine phosphatase family protein [Vibrio parahaemolyticus]